MDICAAIHKNKHGFSLTAEVTRRKLRFIPDQKGSGSETRGIA